MWPRINSIHSPLQSLFYIDPESTVVLTYAYACNVCICVVHVVTCVFCCGGVCVHAHLYVCMFFQVSASQLIFFELPLTPRGCK